MAHLVDKHLATHADALAREPPHDQPRQDGQRSTEDQVRQASQRFYAALNLMANGDPGPMADVWSHDRSVTTMHPIGGREIGWDEVKGPWQQVAGLASEGRVGLTNQHIQASADMAVEVGDEKGQFTLGGRKVSIEHRVTNVYRRDGAIGRSSIITPTSHRR